MASKYAADSGQKKSEKSILIKENFAENESIYN